MTFTQRDLRVALKHTTAMVAQMEIADIAKALDGYACLAHDAGNEAEYRDYQQQRDILFKLVRATGRTEELVAHRGSEQSQGDGQ